MDGDEHQEKEIKRVKCINSLKITVGMGNTITVIWQMGNVHPAAQ